VLRGDFTLDAISPDGALLYFVHYLSRRDITRYEVRAYDVAERRLLPDPVVDPDEAGESMRGTPLARASSADGRWAYTLYDGNGEHPFVHALDTVAATAVCVDLHDLAGRDDLWTMRLATAPSGQVQVRSEAGRTLFAIDPESFAVTVPAAARPRARTNERPRRADSGGAPLWLAAAGVLGLGMLAAAVRRRG
jgi:hypothetical protein